MHRPRQLVALAACALALAGCSALSGRQVHDSPVHPAATPQPSTAPAVPAGGGARIEGATAVQRVLDAAKRNFETIYTFDYRNLGKYRAAGLKVTTSPYSAQYADGLSGGTAQQLRSRQQVQVPTADHAAVVELGDHDRSAVVIVNGKVVTSSTDTTAPTAKLVTVALHMRLAGDAWKVSRLTPGGKQLGRLPANRALQAAVGVSRSCIGDIFGLRRAHFDADFARVMGCTTAELHSRLQASRAAQRKTLTGGGYDLTSRVVGLGVARADGGSAELLVAVDEYRLGREGSRSGPYPLVFDVVVLRANGRWLLSSATQVS